MGWSSACPPASTSTVMDLAEEDVSPPPTPHPASVSATAAPTAAAAAIFLRSIVTPDLESSSGCRDGNILGTRLFGKTSWHDDRSLSHPLASAKTRQNAKTCQS